LWKQLYITYVRPHLEFAVAVWNPYHLKDINALEKVQRRATKIPWTLKNLPYEQRRKKLGLTELEARRTRGDLIQMFKITKNLENISWAETQIVAEARAGYRERFRREITSNNQRHNFFLNRIAGPWNNLPDSVTAVRSVTEFKSKLDDYLKLTA